MKALKKEKLNAFEHATHLQRQAIEIGFKWPDVKLAFQKLKEEVKEIEVEIEKGDLNKILDELGDLFLAAVNVAVTLGVDPEEVLKQTNAKFEGRFKGMLRLCADQGKVFQNCTLQEMIELWKQAKVEG